jgi:hypothetical protein
MKEVREMFMSTKPHRFLKILFALVMLGLRGAQAVLAVRRSGGSLRSKRDASAHAEARLTLVSR